MSESLPLLESRREELLRALANLKDMRPGSVVGAVFLCGKPQFPCGAKRMPERFLFLGGLMELAIFLGLLALVYLVAGKMKFLVVMRINDRTRRHEQL